jgi:oligopeptide transport system ATP-binding protein
MPLLEVENLRTYFHTREGIVRAVDGVSFAVEKGETLGIVGESGSGKSVANYSLLGLVPCPPGRIEGGAARFGGLDLLTCTKAEQRGIRGRRIAMIFQDPMTALNPYMTIGAQIMEPLLVHEKASTSEARARAITMMESVGIQDDAKRMGDYPHQYSGGMRQRVMIAMALITRPEILIADEPTTALDVTVQAQILALIKKTQEAMGMAVILVTHDFGIVAGVCDRVLVMYAGRIVESATTRDLFRKPRHPYTKALMAAMPSVHVKGETLYTIPGMPPDLSRRISGCAFAPRCEHATDRCNNAACALREVEPGHASACDRVQVGEL